MERSLRSLVNRHEILRTLIKEDKEGSGYQLVIDDNKYPLKIERINITQQSEVEQELTKSVNYIYDLSSEYPIRVCIYSLVNPNDNQEKIEDNIEYYLSIVIHHIAFDGWSIEIFLKELEEYYRYYLDEMQGLDTDLRLTDLSIQYKDFALWQRSYLSGERLEKQIGYWKEKLDGYEPLNLITSRSRPGQIDYRGASVYFELEKEVSLCLRELAKELHVSLYSLLLSGYYLMLRGYSNQEDLIVGIPVANRHYSQIEHLVGFFVNSLALRIKIDGRASIKEFIQVVGNEVIEAQLQQDLPFEKLVEELKIPKDTSRHPIFQVMFDVQSFGSGLGSKLLEEYPVNLHNAAKFDVSTFIDDSQDCLRGSFNYAISLYDEETIKGFIKTYVNILKGFADLGKDYRKLERTKVYNLNYIDEEEYKQIIHTWNQTDKAYQDNKTIHELFEEQVERILRRG
ncbi:MAG: hypothetical protein EB000_01995 [Alphaproteobacteria bacterium]|nr:hypothetical protein [Alphaproteobacteria bacterium]